MLDLYNPPRATARTFIVAPLLLAETTQRKRSNVFHDVRESYNRTVAVRGARRRARFERELARRSAA